MKTLIYEDYLAFINRSGWLSNGVSKEFAADNPDYEKQNETNEGCWNCSGCSGCSGLKNAKPVEGQEEIASVPIIPNIHQRVYEAASQPRALAMDTWHTCKNTHCRAGWVVALAGEAGKKLEQFFDTPLAAMKIYDASCPQIKVSPVRFLESNETALEDMKRCAEAEANNCHA